LDQDSRWEKLSKDIFNKYQDLRLILLQEKEDNKTFFEMRPQIDDNQIRITEDITDCLFTLIDDIFSNDIGNSLSIEIEGHQARYYSVILQQENKILLSYLGAAHQSNIEIIQKIIENEMQTIYNQIDSPAYEHFVGLVSPEGLALWVKSRTDEFLLNSVIATCFSSIERITLELKLGDIFDYQMTGTTEDIFHVVFNPAQDTAIASFYNRILEIPQNKEHIFNQFIRVNKRLIVPEFILKDHVKPQVNPILEEIRATRGDESAETQDDEIQALHSFSDELLDRMNYTITALVNQYSAYEISIPYLRKLFKIPPSVIQISLDFLINQGRLNGQLISSKPDLIMPDLLIIKTNIYSSEDEILIQEIQRKVEKYLEPIDKLLIPPESINQVQSSAKTKVLSEESAVRSLTDFSSLIGLADEILQQTKITFQRMNVLELRINQGHADQDPSFNLEKQIHADINSIQQKLQRFKHDINSQYTVLQHFLPLPYKTMETKLIFLCGSPNCNQEISIEFDKKIPTSWRKFLLFHPQVEKVDLSLQELVIRLKTIYERIPEDVTQENMEEIPDLTLFILNYEEREELITQILTNKEFHHEDLTAAQFCDYIGKK
jgi:hypothetical protein